MRESAPFLFSLPQEREIASLAQQVSYSYSSNRRAPPPDLHTDIPKTVLHRALVFLFTQARRLPDAAGALLARRRDARQAHAGLRALARGAVRTVIIIIRHYLPLT